jgi:hypothetical protein
MRVALVCALLLAACEGNEQRLPPPEDITLFDAAGAAFSARRYRVPDAQAPGLLLIGGIGEAPQDWDAFANAARAQGYAVVACSVRFDEDMQPARAALAACKDALVEAGAEAERLAVLGSRSAACLALDYAGADQDMLAAVLISPPQLCGATEPATLVAALTDCPLLLVACEEDTESAASAKSIDAAAGGFRELRLFPEAHRGINILIASASARRHIFAWLEQVMPQ